MTKNASQPINDNALVAALKDDLRFDRGSDGCYYLTNRPFMVRVPKIELLPKTLALLVGNGLILGQTPPSKGLENIWESFVKKTKIPAEMTNYLVNVPEHKNTYRVIHADQGRFLVNVLYLKPFAPNVSLQAVKQGDALFLVIGYNEEPLALCAPYRNPSLDSDLSDTIYALEK